MLNYLNDEVQADLIILLRPIMGDDVSEGEVYPITKQKLESSYELTGSKYSHSFEYDPSIRNIVTGEKISVLNSANGVISTGKSRILAKKLDHHVMLFTAW